MKESKLIEMQNRIANLEAILKQLIPEINGIKDLAFGTFETIKLMPSYSEAIDKLKLRAVAAKEKVEEKKFETDVE
tara:strand:- start:1 stop:228 length:228 start_codon:yes stop_codon:yes gene_type:complete